MKKYILCLLLLSVSACGTSGNEDDKTNFRVINLVSDSSGFDVLLDEKTYIEDLSYGETLGYSDEHTGSHDVLVNENNGFVELVDSSVSLADKKDTTLIVFGTRADPDFKVLRDKNDQPDGDVTKIRFIHTANQTRSVDLYVVAPGTSIDSLSPTIDGLNYKSDSDYVFSEQGVYQVIITDRKSKTPLFTSSSQNFTSKGIYSIFLTDGLDGPSISIIQDR